MVFLLVILLLVGAVFATLHFENRIHIVVLNAFAKTNPSAAAGSDTAWKALSGSLTVGQGSLHLFSAGTNASAELGQNYADMAMATHVFLDTGNSISLFGRFANSDNAVSCRFTRSDIVIIGKNNGRETTLAKIQNPLAVTYPLAALGMAVNGKNIICYEGSKAVVQASDESIPSYGGVAVAVGGDQSVSLFINSISVVPYDQALTLFRTFPQYNAQ